MKYYKGDILMGIPSIEKYPCLCLADSEVLEAGNTTTVYVRILHTAWASFTLYFDERTYKVGRLTENSIQMVVDGFTSGDADTQEYLLECIKQGTLK